MAVESWPPAWLTPVSEEDKDRGDGLFAVEFAETYGSVGKDGIAGFKANFGSTFFGFTHGSKRGLRLAQLISLSMHFSTLANG